MSILREIPPTAGFPFYRREFFGLFSKREARDSLESGLKSYLETGYLQITYSGTAAFYFILEGLKELSRKKTVIIPSYICPLVPLAVNRAGLKVEVCDINKEDFNFEPAELETLCNKNDDILAIVVAHLGGIPLDFESVKKAAEKHKIFIIEDCAQALGADYHGKKVGTLGDFGFFSLCRGKGLTTYEGGVLISNQQEYENVIDAKARQLAKRNLPSEILKILELFGYWVFYRPSLFWFVYQLPKIFWNLRGKPLKAFMEDYSVDFGLHKISRLRKGLGHIGFCHLEEEINKQRAKAAIYIDRLKDIKGIKIIQELPASRATYPYLTLIFDTKERRDRALRILEKEGLGASIVYAYAINDYDYLKSFLPKRNYFHARDLAERSMTLSTNTFLRKQDLETIIEKIKSI